MTVWLVWVRGFYSSTVLKKICATKELAFKYINQQTAWKKAFKKKFYISFDNVNILSDEMISWLHSQDVDYKCVYYVTEEKVYDN